MDIVHHALIGGIGYTALAAVDQDIAGIAFMAGSTLPDLDVALMAFGKRTYLRNHQGFTHSLLLSPLYALMVAVPLTLPFGFDLVAAIAALTGFCIHYVLDLSNTYGISIFWPVTRRKFSFDAVFFIDTVTWSLTALFYVAIYLAGLDTLTVFWSWLAAVILYIAGKYILHAYTMKKLNSSYAIPGSFNPLEYFILVEEGDHLKTFLYNALTGKERKETVYKKVPKRYQEMAEQSTVFRDMSTVAKSLHITDVDETNDTVTIVAQDLAVRNFGGKFGRTVLEFNNEGSLVSEMAHI